MDCWTGSVLKGMLYKKDGKADKGLFWWFGLSLPFFLVVRTALDPLSEFKLSKTMDINVAAVYGVAIGLLSLLFVADRWRAGDFCLDRVAKAFMVFLVFLLFWVPVAYFNFGKAGLLCATREWIRAFVIFTVYLAFYQLARCVGVDRVITVLFLSLPVPLAMATRQIFLGERRIWGLCLILTLLPFTWRFSWALPCGKRGVATRRPCGLSFFLWKLHFSV